MAFSTINLTEPVLEKDLAAYGAKPGQHDCYPDGIAVFAVNTDSATVSSGTVYITPAGELSSATDTGCLAGVTLADCPAGAGIYAVVQGLVPGDTPAFVAYTVA